MKLVRNFYVQGVNTETKHIRKESIMEVFLFAVFLIFLYLTRYSYHLLFHTSAELFVCVISFGLFFISINTSSMLKNNFIVFLGIGYFFIGIIDMFHIFIYSGVSIIFKTGDQSRVVQFWMSGRYMTAFTLLGSTLLLYKNLNKFRTWLIFLAYFLASCGVIAAILYFKVFPACYVAGHGLTRFKIISELVITVIILFVAILYFRKRKNIDFKLFFNMEFHLILMAFSELLFTDFFNPSDWTNVWSHIVRVLSYFFLYKAIIETGLKRPYNILFDRINNIDNQLKQEQQQRMMIEDMLVKNDKCYELIINNSSDAIIVTSEGKLIFANDRAEKIFGAYNSGELIGMELMSFVHPDDRTLVRKHMETSYLGQTSPVQYEYKIMSRKGHVIDLESTSDLLVYQGKLSNISILKDISSRKQISKLKSDIRDNERVLNETKEYNKLLTEFFSNISHELKTPLNVILGAIQILNLPHDFELPYTFEENLNKYHKVMKQNCYRLLRLVNNLIDLSKFDSGFLKLNLCNQNIVNVVEEITLSVADYVENRGLSITFDTDCEEKIIAVDADKIERIILNLLSNSIKFTDKGGSILISMSDRGDRISISVRDTGIGIPKDKLETIFERFGQVDKTLTRNREGSGIGLSLVKTLVEMHGGIIKISSIEGHGSQVYMELPVKVIHDESISANRAVISRTNVEKINVEFSDIYS
ncbi:MASE3 domain-containing protein [Clostridium sp. BNL1100]|uniref:sensor histidine kinase n=1 Tax=Clostridium sp. BNL1100 TaxID=755731 RepID=UPI00024A7FD5|nr:MASE3 domain-containing protein [Clostridium sp. BNL1100]AEY68085.1 PAS domain S-box [Clostridium sp. BNL1100]